MTFPETKTKLVVLVSDVGTGTNLQAIIDGVEKGTISAEISAVISDNENAEALERAREHNLNIEISASKEELLPILKKLNPDYIALAGWKQFILDEVIVAYPNKILNLHPGLIPDTEDGVVKNGDGTEALWNKGMLATKAIKNFLDQKSTYAGSSIHFLTLNFDYGPVLGRAFEKIEEYDNVESLYSRLKKKENALYVEVLEKLTKKLKVLIIGSGGREHAVGWKVKQSDKVGQIYFAPGNAGTSQIGINVPINATDISELINFAKEKQIDLTLALPDDPLSLGIVDSFQAEKLRIWGPSKAASELEWSKAYAKDFMKRHNIPTAKYEVFTEFEKAKTYVEKGNLPIVIKASGLALGKGVTVAQTKEEAIETLKKILIDKIFGNSGNEVVIEEFLSGIEISIHAISDSKNWKMFPSSQDHKRVYDNNAGPNTGGMGVIAPLPFMDDAMMAKIEREIVAPTILGMAKEGRPFTGILYPGIMLTNEGPKVFEFNSRFGDPETQVYMRLLDMDIIDIFDASIDGKLENLKIRWKNTSACNIVVASGGYPSEYKKGVAISGIEAAEEDENIVVFHAGTKLDENGNLVTNGGRVLGVSAIGDNLKDALLSSYKAISKIEFEKMQFRKDIGKATLTMLE